MHRRLAEIYTSCVSSVCYLSRCALGLLATHTWSERHCERLRHHQTAWTFKVIAHTVWMDLQSLDGSDQAVQSTRGEAEEIWQHRPLGLPGSGGAFMLLDHRAKRHRHNSNGELGSRAHRNR